MDRSLQWDIFCKVIDNFGDIGVCWRLACDVAGRGHKVRLWLDDISALLWMAPSGCEGCNDVEVMRWDDATLRDLSHLEARPPEVIIEAFGCDVALEFISACARIHLAVGLKPSWINLEYLSAEGYVERCHAKPSPVRSGPAAGWTKLFFFPGFTRQTGGLLREPDLAARQAAFDRGDWLRKLGIPFVAGKPEKLVSMFCYEPAALKALLDQLALHGLQGQPVRLLVTAGRATQAVKALEAVFNDQIGLQTNEYVRGQLSISYLGLLSQKDFDRLLWACDLNFVRGEDSLVRAIWAGRPLVWQLYPQTDEAHVAKLNAFMNLIEAPPSLRRFMTAWNGHGCVLPTPEPGAWAGCIGAVSGNLRGQDDLVTQLIRVVAQNRSDHATATR